MIVIFSKFVYFGPHILSSSKIFGKGYKPPKYYAPKFRKKCYCVIKFYTSVPIFSKLVNFDPHILALLKSPGPWSATRPQKFVGQSSNPVNFFSCQASTRRRQTLFVGSTAVDALHAGSLSASRRCHRLRRRPDYIAPRPSRVRSVVWSRPVPSRGSYVVAVPLSGTSSSTRQWRRPRHRTDNVATRQIASSTANRRRPTRLGRRHSCRK